MLDSFCLTIWTQGNNTSEFLKSVTIIQLVWFQWKGCKVAEYHKPCFPTSSAHDKELLSILLFLYSQKLAQAPVGISKCSTNRQEKDQMLFILLHKHWLTGQSWGWERTKLFAAPAGRNLDTLKACRHCKNESWASNSRFLGFLFCSSSVISCGNAQSFPKTLMWKQHYHYTNSVPSQIPFWEICTHFLSTVLQSSF